MPTILFNVICMWEVASSSSGMADVGAYHTVDAQRHARVLPCSPSRVNVGAHNTAWILACLEGSRAYF